MRWGEIEGAQRRKQGLALSACPLVIKAVNSQTYQLDANPEITLKLRWQNLGSRTRQALTEVLAAIQRGDATARDERLATNIEEKIALDTKDFPAASPLGFNGRMTCLVPDGGIVSSNVQRMLVSSGIEGALPHVPMAVFIEPS